MSNTPFKIKKQILDVQMLTQANYTAYLENTSFTHLLIEAYIADAVDTASSTIQQSTLDKVLSAELSVYAHSASGERDRTYVRDVNLFNLSHVADIEYNQVYQPLSFRSSSDSIVNESQFSLGRKANILVELGQHHLIDTTLVVEIKNLASTVSTHDESALRVTAVQIGNGQFDHKLVYNRMNRNTATYSNVIKAYATHTTGDELPIGNDTRFWDNSTVYLTYLGKEERFNLNTARALTQLLGKNQESHTNNKLAKIIQHEVPTNTSIEFHNDAGDFISGILIVQKFADEKSVANSIVARAKDLGEAIAEIEITDPQTANALKASSEIADSEVYKETATEVKKAINTPNVNA